MTFPSFIAARRLRRLVLAATLPFMLFAGVAASAAPGAHGPGGEHLDAPGQAAAGGAGAPRLEAKSEAFELVGVLHADEFSMLVNRFETSEPVLDAKVEVESGGLKAVAKFHSDLGDYSVDDAAFLKALKAPGEHAILVTLVAGAEADLLEGSLKSAGGAADAHGHAHEGIGHGLPRTAWILLALVVVGAAIVVFKRRTRTTAGATR